MSNEYNRKNLFKTVRALEENKEDEIDLLRKKYIKEFEEEKEKHIFITVPTIKSATYFLYKNIGEVFSRFFLDRLYEDHKKITITITME